MQASDIFIHAEGLYRTFLLPNGEQKVVLRNVNVHLDSGQSLAIEGPSGVGKSTLLNCLGTLDRPDRGIIVINGTDVTTKDTTQTAHFRNQEIGFVFQDHHLLYACSVLENVLLPTLAYASSVDVTAFAESLLERVGLNERKDSFPQELSGGESQRAAICRALINKPSVLLCDEPTGSLDRENGRKIADLLLEVAHEQGVIVIVASHDHEFTARFDKLMHLDDGVLKESCQ